MQRTCVMAVVLACAALPAAAVNKCTGKDGSVKYQDAPCENHHAAAETLKTWPNSSGSTRSGAVADFRMPQVQPVRWQGNPDADLLRAEALLDAMRTEGRACEWALKVTQGASIAEHCVPFLSRLQQGGDFAQVSERIQLLMQDRAWAERALPGLRRCLRVTEDVVRQKELALAHLGVR